MNLWLKNAEDAWNFVEKLITFTKNNTKFRLSPKVCWKIKKGLRLDKANAHISQDKISLKWQRKPV